MHTSACSISCLNDLKTGTDDAVSVQKATSQPPWTYAIATALPRPLTLSVVRATFPSVDQNVNVHAKTGAYRIRFPRTLR